jgi:hypothetical protein
MVESPLVRLDALHGNAAAQNEGLLSLAMRGCYTVIQYGDGCLGERGRSFDAVCLSNKLPDIYVKTCIGKSSVNSSLRADQDITGGWQYQEN